MSAPLAIVEHLMGDRLLSGWGVRTMAEGEGAYSPIEYHNGTVWPHDNALIAAGLRRYGFAAEAARIAEALLKAAAYFAYRLLDVFAGYPRALTHFPVEYPTASSPQAWAGGRHSFAAPAGPAGPRPRGRRPCAATRSCRRASRTSCSPASPTGPSGSRWGHAAGGEPVPVWVAASPPRGQTPARQPAHTTGFPDIVGYMSVSATLKRIATAAPPGRHEALARYFRVLGDPTRLRILEALADSPRTVSELVELTGAPQSRVSNHLACLRFCQFVETERRGRQVLYRPSDPRIPAFLELGRTLPGEQAEHLASCRRIGPEWV